MFRSVLSSLIALVFAGEAYAFNPEGAMAPLTDLGGRHGFSIALSGVDTSESRSLAEERPLQMQQAKFDFAWSRGGFSVAVSAGHMAYVDYALPTLMAGSALLTGVTVRHGVTGIAGGALAAEFSAHRYFVQDTSTDTVAVSLRWCKRF